MTESEDELVACSIFLEAVQRYLDGLPAQTRSALSLHMASRMVEYAAFENAGAAPAEAIAEMILVAAELDRRFREMQDP